MLLPSLLALLAVAQAPVTQPPVDIGQEVEVPKPGQKADDAFPPSSKPLRIGVVPSLGKGAGAESERLAAYFSRALGAKVEPVVFENHDAEANALVAGRIDFAWMPPLQAFNASIGGAQILIKLIRKGAGNYRSVFFVRDDSKIRALADVKGATVAWVEANSATGHIFPLAMLAREKLPLTTLFKEEKYLGTHDAVCKAVWDKKVDLGATLADEPRAGGKMKIDGCEHILGKDAAKLRILAVSEPVPNDVIAVRKALDPKLVDRLREAVFAMSKSPAGKKVLHDDLFADDVAAVAPGDFDPVQHALEAASESDSK